MDIPGILYRLASNTATDAERADFAGYLKGLTPAAYEALMLQYEAIDQGAAANETPDAAIFARIVDEIDILEGLERQQHDEGLPPQRSLVRRIVWTAAACLLLAAGVYLLTRPSHSTLPTPQVAVIRPGGNKAVLTLSNGVRMTLDSLPNGRLTGQGAADVIKLANGKLQYQAANDPSAAILYNTLTTPRGGQYQLVLSDGTKVWLNAASSIQYPTAFTGKDREVNVTGEAYFEVARDDRHPFKVNIGTMGVEVLGTSFDVNAYQDEADPPVHTTLLDGAVRVSLGAKTQVIHPGQQANIAFNDQHLSVTNDVDLEAVMAWKNGKLVFRKGDIRELMQEISRWYDVDIRYRGAAPSGGFYGLIDRNVPLSSVLHVLSAYGIPTSMENKTIIVQ